MCEVPAVQRQIQYLFFCDDRADLGSRRLQQFAGGFHRHGLLHRAKLQVYVDSGGLIDSQSDARYLRGLEAGGMEADEFPGRFGILEVVLDPLDPAPTATPEPATLLLWGTSMGGLALARWYRRRPPASRSLRRACC